jgi:hypothetical protein
MQDIALIKSMFLKFPKKKKSNVNKKKKLLNHGFLKYLYPFSDITDF